MNHFPQVAEAGENVHSLINLCGQTKACVRELSAVKVSCVG